MLKVGDRVRIVTESLGDEFVNLTGCVVVAVAQKVMNIRIRLDIKTAYGDEFWFSEDELESVNDGSVSEER